MKKIILLQVVLLVLGLKAAAANPVYPIQTPELQQLLGAHVLILPEGPLPLSPEEVIGRADFVPLTALTDELKGLENYWLKVTLDNQLTHQSYREWILHLPLSLSHITAFLQNGDGFSPPQLTGFFVPIAQRSFAPTLKANLVKFSLLPGGQQILLIRARSDRATVPPKFELQVETADLFFQRLQDKKQVNALFIGFCLMMLIYTLVLRVYSGDNTYSFYAVYLISIGIYVAYVNGDIHDRLIPLLIPDHPKYIYLVKLITYCGIISYMGFFRYFLDLKQLLPSWDRFFQRLSWIALPVLLLDLYFMLTTNFSYHIADRITLTYAFVFLAASFLFLFPLYRTRDRKGYFVITGLVCMGVGMLITALDRVRTVDYSILSLEIGAGLELIVFSIGLAYRQQIIRREKQLATFELEKNQLIQQQERAEMERQKELNTLKTELYTNITHELRTPLTVIMGMTEQITGHAKEKELINRNTQSLLRLVNQVMDLSQLEAGRMELQLKQADIIHYLRYLCESFHSSADAKQIQLSFSSDLEQLIMDFDNEKIQQIIYNLLSNALKFTPVGGSIQFSTRRKMMGQQAVFLLEIKDSGSGIPPAEIPHIFDRFYQSSVHYHQQYGGSGIGLALTKQLVLLMEGTIEVESTVNEGTTFLVQLPIHQRKMVQDLQPPANLPIQEPLDHPQDTNGRPEWPHLLIIEDNKDVIEYIQTCLEDKFQISKATNGRQGLTLAYEQIPDLIISDVMMPEIDGYDVCEALKGDLRTSHIPVVLLTARADQQGRVTGLKRGADAYITKPFDKEELLIRIDNLIALRAALQKHFLRAGLLNLEKPESIEDPDALFLQNLKQTVLQQIDNPSLSVSDLHATVPFGNSQLYRKLKALTGLTPIQFIKNIRWEQATYLLLQGQHSIAEISYAVGFNDPNYFSRAFQQHFGYPPSEHKDRANLTASTKK